jgi:hypothetical protein
VADDDRAFSGIKSGLDVNSRRILDENALSDSSGNQNLSRYVSVKVERSSVRPFPLSFRLSRRHTSVLVFLQEVDLNYKEIGNGTAIDALLPVDRMSVHYGDVEHYGKWFSESGKSQQVTRNCFGSGHHPKPRRRRL